MSRLISIAAIALSLAISSYGANRFVEAGWPSPSREWYASEYTRITKLLTTQSAGLPTFDGADGEAVFRRMVNIENFSLSRNLSLPLPQRMEDAFAMQAAQNTILKAYIQESNRGGKLSRELAEQLAFSLRTSTTILTLIEEFLPTIKKDEKYEIRMEGLKKVKMSLETIYSGAEQSLGEKSFYTGADITTILRAMSETLPKFKTVFSDDFRSELIGRLKKRSAERLSDEDSKNIESILRELEPNKSVQSDSIFKCINSS